NVGHAENLAALDDGAAEQREALGVIVVVAQRRAVESFAVEKWRIVDKVILNVVMQAAVENGTETIAVVERNRDAGHHAGSCFELGLAVLGKEDADLLSHGGERLRQRSHHIGEASGLGKRNALRGDEPNVHVYPLLTGPNLTGRNSDAPSRVGVPALPSHSL